MDFKTWKNEKAFSVGAELEVRIQNTKSLILEDYSSQIMPLLPDSIKSNIHQEFLECMVEIVSPVCESSSQIVEYIKFYIKSLLEIGKKKGFILSTSGSHSYKVEHLKSVQSRRYRAFSKEYGLLLKKFHICGFHIHVGLSSSDDALHTYNYMLDKLPIFLALSVNSPFFDGEDSGLLSYRTQLFAQLPRAGVPEYFDSYEDISSMFETLKRCRSVESCSDLWWDLRISPKFKTVEIRICDATNDFDRLEDFINFYQAICFYGLNKKVKKLPHQILQQNKWNATRHGFDGMYQNSSTCNSIREYFLDLIDKMQKDSVFDKLSISPMHIQRLRDRAHQTSLAIRQKEVYLKTSSLYEVEKLGVFK